MRRYGDFTADGADIAPHRRAIVADEGSRTFAELDHRAERLAAALRRRGLAPGERVVWLATNELEFAETQSACLKGGYPLVPLNWRLSVDELRYLVAETGPAVFIHGRAEEERTREILRGGPAPLVLGLGGHGSYEDLLASADPDPAANPDDPELLATILYTSGTTGRPKGAMIDRMCLTSRLWTTAIEVRATRDDVFLCSLPMFHIAAYMAYAYLMRGAALIQSSVPFDAGRVMRIMVEEGVTDLLAVPTMLHELVREAERNGPFEGLRLAQVNYGGASMPPALLKRVVQVLGCAFHQQYGLTETQMLAVLQAEDHLPDDREGLESVGRPAVSATVRIFDPGGGDVAPGEIGEIVSRGPSVMRGYWRNPEATERAMRDGWLHTGDLGTFDKSGRIHVVDRVDDMIISGGENVYPTEIESILVELPEVEGVAVIGLPDEQWGQAVTAVVLESAPPVEELEKYLRTRVAGYKVPRRWVRLDELPRNATGKILRRVLKQRLAGAPEQPAQR